jgi:hypothetical protein
VGSRSLAHPSRVGAALGLTAAGLIFAGGALAITTGWKVQPSPSPGHHGSILFGVAASSRTNAWAVGSHSKYTLVEHWNGKGWKVQRSPNASGNENRLLGVAAVSSKHAWAVGYSGAQRRTLIEHWNGKAWRVQPSPNPSGGQNVLFGVTATSSTNAWAVGSSSAPYGLLTVVEHWNGKAWKAQASANPGGFTQTNQLLGVAASSRTNAWAVGDYTVGTGTPQTLIEHKLGTAWTVVPSPDPGINPYGDRLSGVAATSANNAWAVGYYYNGTTDQTLIEHWDGTAWTVQPSPNPGGSGNPNWLGGVTAISATNAWAVGYYYNGTTKRTLALHWNGKAWKTQASASPHGAVLNGVTATSSTNAWAGGWYGKRTLIERWHR